MHVPAHIPKKLVFDFDLFRPGPENDQDPFLTLMALRKQPRIFWAPRYGGHWVFTRGADFPRVLNDPATFSSRTAVFQCPGQASRGWFLPLELDGPLHRAYRKPLEPLFAERSVDTWLKHARKMAAEMIEDIRQKGQCEFMADFGSKFPATFLLSLFDVPAKDAERLAQRCWTLMRLPEHWNDDPMQLVHYARRLVLDRTHRPGRDLLSQILNADMGAGRRMGEHEALAMTVTLLGAELNPMVVSIGWAALFLARNPWHRAQLAAGPALTTNAVFELQRRFSASNIWRVVNENVSFEGVELKRGDKVFLATALHGLDEAIFERPTEIDFHRHNASAHLAFGVGPHQCPGRSLAVQLTAIFLEEWLKKIPDFQIPPDAHPLVETLSLSVVSRLPLRWEQRKAPRQKRAH